MTKCQILSNAQVRCAWHLPDLGPGNSRDLPSTTQSSRMYADYRPGSVEQEDVNVHNLQRSRKSSRTRIQLEQPAKYSSVRRYLKYVFVTYMLQVKAIMPTFYYMLSTYLYQYLLQSRGCTPG